MTTVKILNGKVKDKWNYCLKKYRIKRKQKDELIREKLRNIKDNLFLSIMEILQTVEIENRGDKRE